MWGGKRNRVGQSLTLTMCTETKRLKLNPRIPLALWQASEKCCCSAHVIPHYLGHVCSSGGGEQSAAHLHFSKALYTIFSGLARIAYFSDHPPNSNRQLAQSKIALALLWCQGFHPEEWELRQPHASTQCHKHLWRELTHTDSYFKEHRLAVAYNSIWWLRGIPAINDISWRWFLFWLVWKEYKLNIQIRSACLWRQQRKASCWNWTGDPSNINSKQLLNLHYWTAKQYQACNKKRKLL